MKYCIQILFICMSLITAACTTAEAPEVGLAFPIEQALSADGLKAEVGVYSAGANPQLEGDFETVALRENDGKLSCDIDLSVLPGDKLIRVYLIHVSSDSLLWVGEWEATVVGSEASSIGSFLQGSSDGDASKFKGDVHPLITDEGEPFGPSGESNIDQLCTEADNGCDDDFAEVCDPSGFGFVATDCALNEVDNGVGVCRDAACTVVCDDPYTPQGETCVSICGDGILNTDGGEACDDSNTVNETTCAYGTVNCEGCSSDCSETLMLTGPYCGDNYLDADGGEACDDGDNINNACAADCSEILERDCANTWGGAAVEDDCGSCDTDPSNDCETCGNSGECPFDYYCSGGVCLPQLGLGSACTAASDCGTGNCAQGVCCDQACDSPCRSCLMADTGSNDGICNGVSEGFDPYDSCADAGVDSCGSNGTCDGAGHCMLYAANTLCAAATCEEGGARGDRVCDGNGTCNVGELVPCGDAGCADGQCLSEESGLTDNNNGTITDSASGITWMKCVQGMTYDEGTNSCTGTEQTFQYCDAGDNSCNGGVSGNLLDDGGNSSAWDTCNTLSSAGHTDWRVPTKGELGGLIHCSNGHVVNGVFPARCSDGDGDFTTPAIDTSLFSNLPSTFFWTSASYAAGSNDAWSVSFLHGYITRKAKANSLSVLCVRNDEPEAGLRDNNNGTITDSAKGITWMKCAQGMTFNAESNTCEGFIDSNSSFEYCDALDNSCNGGVSGGLLDGGGNSEVWNTCNTLSFAGYTDWRVPNKEELGGLIHCSNGHVIDGDYSTQCSDGDGEFIAPAIDTSLFSNFPHGGFWTSASDAEYSYYAWYVDFPTGDITYYSKSHSWSALCVRD